jgi:C-terminal processing protease CtpA/Prc
MAVGDAPTRNWMFRDIVESGPAHRAGIRDGELLLAIDGNPVRPPDPVLFTLGRQFTLTLGHFGSVGERVVKVDLPAGSTKGRPAGLEPKAVVFKDLGGGVGHLRVSYFPGAIGYGFIKDLDAAIRQLTAGGVKKFVLDLRGNPGGGLGSLRVMSLLSSEPTPIGYSLTRKAIQNGWKRDQLPRINHIPVGKWEQIMMAVRFKVLNRDRSIALATEKLGRSALAGNTVVLANSQTRSAAEMVVAFVKEHRLATIVGDKTPGEVLGAVNFRLPHGYKLRMPIATWQTWEGTAIEGVGVAPDKSVSLDPAELASGKDRQIADAISLLRGAATVSS